MAQSFESSRPPLRFSRVWWISGCVLIGIIIYFSLTPNPPSATHLTSDKVQHFAAYWAAMFWFAGITDRRRYPMIAFSLLSISIFIEVAQGAMALGRQADYHDVIANASGIAVALVLAYTRFELWMVRVERRLRLARA